MIMNILLEIYLTITIINMSLLEVHINNKKRFRKAVVKSAIVAHVKRVLKLISKLYE